MKLKFILSASVFCGILFAAQNIRLQGQITDLSHSPIANAQVKLLSLGLFDSTDAQGRFEILQGNTPVLKRLGSQIEISANPQDETPYQVDAISIRGEVKQLATGLWDIAQGAIKIPVNLEGWWYLRLRLGSDSYTAVYNSYDLGISNIQEWMPLSTLDQVEISKTGFQTLTLPMHSFRRDLGKIRLLNQESSSSSTILSSGISSSNTVISSSLAISSLDVISSSVASSVVPSSSSAVVLSSALSSSSVSSSLVKLSQTIIFNPLSGKTLGDASFNVSATSTTSSINPITFSSLTPMVCSVTGTMVKLLSAGTCSIKASQVGNVIYNDATDVSHSFVVNSTDASITYGSLIDYRDGTTYKSVVIGTQTWMAENLKYTPSGMDENGAWCYENDPSKCVNYGRLYDWATAMDLPKICNTTDCASQVKTIHQGVCPEGWHIPSDDEWKILELYTGISWVETNMRGWRGNIGGKLRSNNGFWNTTSTNEYGFSALPAGYYNRGYNISFYYLGGMALFLISTQSTDTNSWLRIISRENQGVFRDNAFNKNYGFSLRCVKDAESSSSSSVAFSSVTPSSSSVAISSVALISSSVAISSITPSSSSTTSSSSNTAPKLDVTIADLTKLEDFAITTHIPNLNNLFSDVDGDALTYSVSVSNNKALASISGTALNLSSVKDSNGSAVVIVIANDGRGGVASANFNLTITAVNDAPSFTAGTDVTVAEDASAYSGAWASNLVKGPADESAQTLSFSVVSNDNSALFSTQPAVNSSGTLTFTSASNKSGVANLKIKMMDNGGRTNGGVDTTAYANLVITVTAVNDAPVAGSDSYSIPVDGAIAVGSNNVLSNDTDVDGDALSASLVTNASSGTAVLNSDGTFSYSPNAGYTGTDTFTYKVSDGKGGTATATVSVVVGSSGNTLTDARDGKTYKTVTIGSQVWMAQNLNYGTKVLGANAQSNNTLAEKYCYNDVEDSCTTFGGLYQWAEMMNLNSSCNSSDCAAQIQTKHQGICPMGWHIPTDAEWKTMEMSAGLTQVEADATGYRGTVGTKLKSTTGWSGTPGNGTNNFGFSALSAGRNSNGSFLYVNSYTFFWSASQSGLANAWNRILDGSNTGVSRNNYSKTLGYSLRCLQD